MPARPPHTGLKQPLSPPDGEDPTARAELHLLKIPIGAHPAIPSEEQVIPAVANPVNRILTTLRHTGISAGLRFVVPYGDASQMLTTVERISITAIWAVTVTSTLVITIAAGLPAAVVCAIITVELVGFALTLLATRWRRRKKEK
jgi:quinol-cytochrome oxidoreductase complex cytochrome b subunit